MKSIRLYFPSFLYPVHEGAPFVVNALIQELLSEGHAVEWVCWDPSYPNLGGALNLLPKGLQYRFLGPLPSNAFTKGRLKRTFCSLFSPQASQELLFYPPELLAAWNQLPPVDLAIYTYSFAWSWLQKGRQEGPLENKRVVSFHNLESHLIQERAQHASVWTRWIHALNSRKLKAHEQELGKDRVPLVDECWFLSSPDLKDWVKQGGSPKKAILRPPSLPKDHYSERVLARREKGPLNTPKSSLLGFVGRLDFRPNSRGVEWILDALCPQLEALQFTGKIIIVGKGATPSLITRMRQTPRVEYQGYLESLEKFWREIDALLVPHREGSGIRIKLFEGLLSEVPCLTHPEAAQRLPDFLQTSPFLFISESEKEWAQHLTRRGHARQPSPPSKSDNS